MGNPRDGSETPIPRNRYMPAGSALTVTLDRTSGIEICCFRLHQRTGLPCQRNDSEALAADADRIYVDHCLIATNRARPRSHGGGRSRWLSFLAGHVSHQAPRGHTAPSSGTPRLQSSERPRLTGTPGRRLPVAQGHARSPGVDRRSTPAAHCEAFRPGSALPRSHPAWLATTCRPASGDSPIDPERLS